MRVTRWVLLGLATGLGAPAWAADDQDLLARAAWLRARAAEWQELRAPWAEKNRLAEKDLAAAARLERKAAEPVADLGAEGAPDDSYWRAAEAWERMKGGATERAGLPERLRRQSRKQAGMPETPPSPPVPADEYESKPIERLTDRLR